MFSSGNFLNLTLVIDLWKVGTDPDGGGTVLSFSKENSNFSDRKE